MVVRYKQDGTEETIPLRSISRRVSRQLNFADKRAKKLVLSPLQSQGLATPRQRKMSSKKVFTLSDERPVADTDTVVICKEKKSVARHLYLDDEDSDEF